MTTLSFKPMKSCFAFVDIQCTMYCTTLLISRPSPKRATFVFLNYFLPEGQELEDDSFCSFAWVDLLRKTKNTWFNPVLCFITVPLRINLTWNAFAIRMKLEREMKQQQNGYGTGAERIWNKQVLFNLFSRTRSHLQERVLENVPA